MSASWFDVEAQLALLLNAFHDALLQVGIGEIQLEYWLVGGIVFSRSHDENPFSRLYTFIFSPLGAKVNEIHELADGPKRRDQFTDK
jgi:hypothetical protein